MDNTEKTLFNFENVSTREAGTYAQQLQSFLLSGEKIQIDIIKEDKDTQDFGATLAIVLSSHAIAALAKGFADWLKSKQNKKLTIITKKGKVIGSNLSSDDIERILQEHLTA